MNPHDVKAVVREILSTPEFANQLQSAISRNRSPSRTSSPGIVASSTPQSRIEEIRRIFPSIRGTPTAASTSRGRRGRFQALAPKDFQKDVFLIPATVKKVLSGTEKAKAFENGYGICALKIKKEWSEQQVRQHLIETFSEKIINDSFDILMPISTNLVKPNLSSGDELNGEMICRIFKQKPLYIRQSDTETNDLTESITLSDDDALFERETLCAIEHSLRESEERASQVNESLTSFDDLLKNLQAKISDNSVTIINIYREDLFNCCLRALRRQSFNPFHKISVNFTDTGNVTEGAIDMGGPTREMFRLILKYFQNSIMFDGDTDVSRNVTLNSVCLENRHYYECGRLITLSILHCGIGPQFFSETLFSYLTSGIEDTQPVITDICDSTVKEQLLSIISSNSIEDLQTAIEKGPALNFAGIQVVTEKDFENKENLFKYALKYHAIHRTRPALEQLKEGINIANFLSEAISFPNALKELFCYQEKQLLSFSKMSSLFLEIRSEEGSNKSRTESKTLAFWKDYLIDCEESLAEVTLKDVLAFATGSDCVPLFGFTTTPTIQFLHDSPYPKANTCSLTLYLPTVHEAYDTFKSTMDFAIQNGMVFGFE